ncbi:unnamed protein product, partial [Discosporangium mesarthrocarpum]
MVQWEVAKEWRESKQDSDTSPLGGGLIKETTPCGGQIEKKDRVIRLSLLRTCFSELHGKYIPRMFCDLFEDVERSSGGGREGLQFHITEFDVIQGRFPISWEDFDGYVLPGGAASACGGEPWMLVLLKEVQEMVMSGRPILGICLGHQVLAQALGGSVKPRTYLSKQG